MIRRPGRGAGLAIALAAVLAAAAALVARSSFAGAYGSGPYSFPHQPHVSAATLSAALAEAAALDRTGRRPGGGGKVDAECRVCHDYAKGDDAHLSGCATCHVGDKHLEVQVAGAAPQGARFPHAAHLKDPSVTCFSCHRPVKDMGWVEFSLPEGGLGRAGVDGRPGGKHGEFTCADCHRSHEPKGGLVKQDERTGDGKECGVCHAGATSILPLAARPGLTSRPFRHADHGGPDVSCDVCHAPIRRSATIWDYDPAAATEAACTTCHVDADGKPLVGVEPMNETVVPFVRFSKFPHDKHLAAKVTDDCRTCHYPERSPASAKLFPARAPSAEPVGRNALVDYDRCTPCHPSWKVENHGVGEWSCFKCHVGTASADGELALATVQVWREALPDLDFVSHEHPGVTRRGRGLDDPHDGGKPCRECHVADLATIASRVRGRFAHRSHLPQQPASHDCIGCHTSPTKASWSADLKRLDLFEPVTTSDADALARPCLACHVGATSMIPVDLRGAPRRVPEFDHKGHVTGAAWKGAKGIACTECHDGGGAAGYTTPEDVLSCTRCHGHDPAQPEKLARTGPTVSSPSAASACVHCHDDVTAPFGGRERVVRRHLSLLVTERRQHHDKTGDCASCHARDGRPYVYAERIRKAKVALSIHEDAALASAWFNQPGIAKTPDAQGRTCATCHREEPRGYLRALTPK